MSALRKVNYSENNEEEALDLTGHMLLTFKDRGVDNDVPFVPFQKKYEELIMSHMKSYRKKMQRMHFCKSLNY